MVHLLSQLDPMVWLMMVVVAIGFVVSAAVLVELLPGNDERTPAVPPNPDGAVTGPGLPSLDHDSRQAPPD